MTLDPYLILNVSPRATPAQIKRSYKRLARLYHPDLNEQPDAARRMQEINWAYDLLSDPAARNVYDQALRLAEPLEATRWGYRAWHRARRAAAEKVEPAPQAYWRHPRPRPWAPRPLRQLALPDPLEWAALGLALAAVAVMAALLFGGPH